MSTITPKQETPVSFQTLSVGRSSVPPICAETAFIREREELDSSAATFAEMSARYPQRSQVFIQLTRCNRYQGNTSPSDNGRAHLGSARQEQATQTCTASVQLRPASPAAAQPGPVRSLRGFGFLLAHFPLRLSDGRCSSVRGAARGGSGGASRWAHAACRCRQ